MAQGRQGAGLRGRRGEADLTASGVDCIGIVPRLMRELSSGSVPSGSGIMLVMPSRPVSAIDASVSMCATLLYFSTPASAASAEPESRSPMVTISLSLNRPDQTSVN